MTLYTVAGFVATGLRMSSVFIFEILEVALEVLLIFVLFRIK